MQKPLPDPVALQASIGQRFFGRSVGNRQHGG